MSNKGAGLQGRSLRRMMLGLRQVLVDAGFGECRSDMGFLETHITREAPKLSKEWNLKIYPDVAAFYS